MPEDPSMVQISSASDGTPSQEDSIAAASSSKLTRSFSKSKSRSRAGSELSDVKSEVLKEARNQDASRDSLFNLGESGRNDSFDEQSGSGDHEQTAPRRSTRLHPDRNSVVRELEESDGSQSTRQYMDHDEEDELLEIAERGALSATTIKKHSKEKSEYVMRDLPIDRVVNPHISQEWDAFCWRCHKSVPTGEQHGCPSCVRIFHENCWWNTVPYSIQNPLDILHPTGKIPQVDENGEAVKNPEVCTECHRILDEENNSDNICNRVGMDKFKTYLLYMMQFVEGHLSADRVRPFAIPVVEQNECSDHVKAKYKEYITRPMDLRQITQNIESGKYRSCAGFLSDLTWIHHNTSIFNGQNNRYTRSACYIVETCQHLCLSMDWCLECFERGMPEPGETVQVAVERGMTTPCSTPHALVWVKAEKYPLWPAIVYRFNGAVVDIRFFGAFEFGVFPKEAVFLYCRSVGTDRRKGRLKLDYENALRQFRLHVTKLRALYDREIFSYPRRTPYDGRLKMFPDDEQIAINNVQNENEPSFSAGPSKETTDIQPLVVEEPRYTQEPPISLMSSPSETSTGAGSTRLEKRGRSDSNSSVDSTGQKRPRIESDAVGLDVQMDAMSETPQEIQDAPIAPSPDGSRNRRKTTITRKIESVITSVRSEPVIVTTSVISSHQSSGSSSSLEEPSRLRIVDGDLEDEPNGAMVIKLESIEPNETILPSFVADNPMEADEEPIAQAVETTGKDPAEPFPREETVLVEPEPIPVEPEAESISGDIRERVVDEEEPEIQRLMMYEDRESDVESAGEKINMRPLHGESITHDQSDVPSFELPEFEDNHPRPRSTGKLDSVLKRNELRRSGEGSSNLDSELNPEISKVISGVGLATSKMSMNALTSELNKALPNESRTSVLHDALIRTSQNQQQEALRRIPRKQPTPSIFPNQSHLIQALRAANQPSTSRDEPQGDAMNRRNFREETLGSLLAASPRPLADNQMRRPGTTPGKSGDRSGHPESPFLQRASGSLSSNMGNRGAVQGAAFNRNPSARPPVGRSPDQQPPTTRHNGPGEMNHQRSLLARTLNSLPLNGVTSRPVNSLLNGGPSRSHDQSNGDRERASPIQTVMRNLVAARPPANASGDAGRSSALRNNSIQGGQRAVNETGNPQTQIELFLRNAKKMVKDKKSETDQVLREMSKDFLETTRLMQEAHQRTQQAAERSIRDLQESMDQSVRKFEVLFAVFQSENEFSHRSKALQIHRVKDLERQRAVTAAKQGFWCCVCQKRAKFVCCGLTLYCSETCQRNHSGVHRRSCAGVNPDMDQEDQIYSPFGVLTRCNPLPLNGPSSQLEQQPSHASFVMQNGWGNSGGHS